LERSVLPRTFTGVAKSAAAEEAPSRTLSLKGRAGSNPAPGRTVNLGLRKNSKEVPRRFALPTPSHERLGHLFVADQAPQAQPLHSRSARKTQQVHYQSLRNHRFHGLQRGAWFETSFARRCITEKGEKRDGALPGSCLGMQTTREGRRSESRRKTERRY